MAVLYSSFRGRAEYTRLRLKMWCCGAFLGLALSLHWKWALGSTMPSIHICVPCIRTYESTGSFIRKYAVHDAFELRVGQAIVVIRDITCDWSKVHSLSLSHVHLNVWITYSRTTCKPIGYGYAGHLVRGTAWTSRVSTAARTSKFARSRTNTEGVPVFRSYVCGTHVYLLASVRHSCWHPWSRGPLGQEAKTEKIYGFCINSQVSKEEWFDRISSNSRWILALSCGMPWIYKFTFLRLPHFS